MSFQKIRLGVYKARFNSAIMSCFGQQNQESNVNGSIETGEELLLNNKLSLKTNFESFSLQSFRDFSDSFPYVTARRWKSAEVISEIKTADTKTFLRPLESLVPTNKLTKVASKKTISLMKLDERDDRPHGLENRGKNGDFGMLSPMLPSGEGEKEKASYRLAKTRSTLRMGTKHKKPTLNSSRNQLPMIEEVEDNSQKPKQNGSCVNFDEMRWKEREKKYKNTLRFEEADTKEHRQRSTNSSKKLTEIEVREMKQQRIKECSYDNFCQGENGSSFGIETMGFHNEKKCTCEELMTPKIKTGNKKEGEMDDNPMKKRKENYGKQKGIGLYDYDFEVGYSYKHYFVDGDYRNIIKKIEREYFLKQKATRSKISQGMSPRASLRKKNQFSRNSKKNLNHNNQI